MEMHMRDTNERIKIVTIKHPRMNRGCDVRHSDEEQMSYFIADNNKE